MFWRRLKAFRRSLSFRLNLWHALVFLISAILLFILTYFLLSAAIDRTDRDPIEARLRESESAYQNGGLSALRDWANRVNNARFRKFFIRLVKSDGAVLLLVVPSNWIEFDLALVPGGIQARDQEWIRVPRDGELDLALASKRLADGTLLQVGRMTDSLAQILAKIRHVFLIVTPPVILLGFVGGALLANRLSRPISGIINAASEIIGTGRMDVRVPTRSSNDELQDLGVLFNRMLEHNEKLFHALRESLDNVAHDLRTPLARLRATLDESLRHPLDRSAAHEAIADALEESQRIETIINTLMDVAFAESGVMKLQITDADVRPLLNNAMNLYDDVAQDKAVSLHNTLEDPLFAKIDAARMRQVFANLLDNAIKYTPHGGEVWISARPQNGMIEVCFRDSGSGIPAVDFPRIWERLYRGDKSRSERGLGLGLSLVKAIVRAHHGRVEVTSREGIGSEFTIYLPAASPGKSQARCCPDAV